MPRGFRVPTVALAAALLALLALLATLQYRWLGQISDAERDRMTRTLNAKAASFAQDFDTELTRAYILFQIDAPRASASDLPAQIAQRYQQWQGSARFPELIKQIFVAASSTAGISLTAFDPSSATLAQSDWPRALDPIKSQLEQRNVTSSPGSGTHLFVMRTIGPPVWPSIPALVVPMPAVFAAKQGATTTVRVQPDLSFAILVLDRDVLVHKVLPALAEQHFQSGAAGIDYALAVVSSGSDVLYRSTSAFSPTANEHADASVDLFAVRPQYVAVVASEISRFAQYTRQLAPDGRSTMREIVRESVAPPPIAAGAPLTLLFQARGSGQTDMMFSKLQANSLAAAMSSAEPAPHWRLLVKHPAGSLEIAVTAARRRNLAISSGILVVLAISIGLLMVSTRRAQNLARQQLEFVATVSHELRTPLAVIRSAADNLADGTVEDERKVRQYGALVRREGVRLSDLVEQVLQFAGLQSWQRKLDLQPVDVRTLIDEAAAGSAQGVADRRARMETVIPIDLPPVRGDEAALRRVFQNLIGNAIKYGGTDGWVGIHAVRDGDRVAITVSDHGLGIASADHARVFEPFYRARDVVSAQIQGAGLGLSLVKRIVDAHGGRISLESAPGKGASFTVTLPALIHPPALMNASRAKHASQAASS